MLFISRGWTIFRLIAHRDAVNLKQSTYLPKSNEGQKVWANSIEMVMMMMGEKNTHMQASKFFLVRFPHHHLLQVLPIHCHHQKNLHK